MRVKPVVAVLTALAATSCARDITAPTTQNVIVGTWASYGLDVARGMAASLKTAEVVITFDADHSYSLTVIDSSNTGTTSSGTWSVTGQPGTLGTIQLHQQSPIAEEWAGVIQVDGARMTYEVTRTMPEVPGVLPPTIAGGFGSSMVGGASSGSDWVQRFIIASALESPPCNPDEASVTGKRPCDPTQSIIGDRRQASGDWNPSGGKR